MKKKKMESYQLAKFPSPCSTKSDPHMNSFNHPESFLPVLIC